MTSYFSVEDLGSNSVSVFGVFFLKFEILGFLAGKELSALLESATHT